jgi:hypothetical protein
MLIVISRSLNKDVEYFAVLNTAERYFLQKRFFENVHSKF